MIERIKELIEKGYGERLIADELGSTRAKIRKILKDNHLYTVNTFENIAGNIGDRVRETTQGKWSYVSGYSNCDSSFVLKCSLCGNESEWNAQILRNKKTPICDCILKEQKKQRDDELHKKQQQDRLNNYIRKNIKLKLKYSAVAHTQTCLHCGNDFIPKRYTQKYCCSKCSSKAYDYRKRETRIKRMKENGLFENISLPRLFKRDKGVCHLCGEQCNYDDYIKDGTTYIVGDTHPSIDHVIPISKGGTHTWDNVKLAHMNCNTNKSNDSNLEMIEDRIRLAI